MNEAKKRTFELTTAFAMGNLLGKLMANKSFSAVPELSDRSRARIEELIALTSITKNLTENIVKEKAPEFWDELSALKVFKEDSMIIDLIDQKGHERDKKLEDLLKPDSFKCGTVSPTSEKEDKKTVEKKRAMGIHAMGQFYGNLFLIEELSKIEDLSPEVKDLLETIKKAAEAHKEDLEETMAIFDPDLLSLIKEVEADQDAVEAKEEA